MQIECQHRKLFFVSIAVFFGYYGLFAWNILVNYFGYQNVGQRVKINYIKISVFNTIILTYQAYASGAMVTCFTVYKRLAIMNNFVKKHADQEFQNKREILKVLNLGSVFFDKISDIMESIKRISSASLVIFLLQGTYFTVLANYSFIAYNINEDSDEVDFAMVVSSLNWCFYFSIFNFWIFYYAQQIKNESQRFENFVQHFASQTNLKAIHERIQTVHLQLQHRRPVVECGVFVVDPKLALHLVSICFSYIVIILQFDLKHY